MNDYEKIDTYKNYKYAIWLNTKKGYRCGYVQIPENHPLYEKSFTDFDLQSVQITFSGRIKNLSGWFIGLDHNHIWDGVDEDAIRKYHPNEADLLIHEAHSYHDGYGFVATLNDVEQECQNLIEELIYIYNKEN